MKGKKLFLIVVSLQVLAIAALLVFIKSKSSPIQVSPLNKESVLATQVGELKSFYEPKPNTLDKVNPWLPYPATYTINEDALNEKYNYQVEKAPGIFRIITLGDSWTYGVYVDTKDNWPERLEDMLNDEKRCENIEYEVINLGVGGYDLQYSAERFRLRGAKYNPDLVLWLVKLDDFGQINELILPRERQIQKEMRVTGEFEKKVKEGINYPSWYRALEEYAQKYKVDEILALQKQILESFDPSYQNPLVFLSFPSVPIEGEDLINGYLTFRPKTYFFKDLTNILDHKELQFAADKHPNIKGHEQIAGDVLNYLEAEDFLPCP